MLGQFCGTGVPSSNDENEVFAELMVVLDELRCKEPPPTLIFRSVKRKSFIVGADLMLLSGEAVNAMQSLELQLVDKLLNDLRSRRIYGGIASSWFPCRADVFSSVVDVPCNARWTSAFRDSAQEIASFALG